MSWGALSILLLLPLLRLSAAQSQLIDSTANTYYSFNRSDFFDASNSTADDLNGLVFLGEAYYHQGALQLTPDSINPDNNNTYLKNNSGRVFVRRPFKLWEVDAAANATDGKRVASFNTTFSINIYRPDNTTAGEGMAFLISSYLVPPPPGSEGGYLGLTNETLNGDASNHFFAVELDTFKEAFLGDPDNNHVGLNINGVNSNRTSSLNFSISPIDPANYTVWVDYDGGARHLWVFMDYQHRQKPAAAVLDAPVDLSQVLLSKDSYFGFAASTGDTYELNCVLSWNLTVEVLPDDKSSMPPWKVGAIAAGVAVFVLGVGICLGLYTRRRRTVRDAASGGSSAALVLGTLKSLPGTPREFDFKELSRATNNFHENMKLGKGGFGEVYRGVLQGENKEVAVKRFSRGSSGPDDFLKELIIINRLRHKHLVPLVGWCHTNGVLLLVYEYMPNGSLDHHLFGGGGEELAVLSWERRYNVIAGVASALQYLHDEYDVRVVHRDLKASNIMLDVKFDARLGDFGLARALETDRTSYAEMTLDGVPGTFGYIAPECFHTGKATRESDVFGFGAVVLEVVCGRSPRSDVGGFKFLSDWVWKLHREGRILEAMDPRLGEFDGDEARRLLLLGLSCSHPIPSERPKTAALVQIVSRAVAPPVVSDFKPAFVWPSGLPEADDGEPSGRMTSSTAMTSSGYASSAGWSPRSAIREGHAGPRDTIDSIV